MTSQGSDIAKDLQPGLKDIDIVKSFSNRGITPTEEVIGAFTWRNGVREDVVRAFFWEADFRPLSVELDSYDTNLAFARDPELNYPEYWSPSYQPLFQVDRSELIMVDSREAPPRKIKFFSGGPHFDMFNSLVEAIEVATLGLLNGWYWYDASSELIRSHRSSQPSELDLEVPPYPEYKRL